jgi:hypothetical protein
MTSELFFIFLYHSERFIIHANNRDWFFIYPLVLAIF